MFNNENNYAKTSNNHVNMNDDKNINNDSNSNDNNGSNRTTTTTQRFSGLAARLRSTR